MKWLRWIGLLLILVHAVAFVMMGRFWTVLHVAHASSFPDYHDGRQPPKPVETVWLVDHYVFKPPNLMEAVWSTVTVSLVTVALLAPSLYLLGRQWPRLAPHLLLTVVAAYVVLPILHTLMTPDSVAQQAEQLKYLNLFTANCFFSVMGVLLGAAIMALADGISDRAQLAAVSTQTGNRLRKPATEEPPN